MSDDYADDLRHARHLGQKGKAYLFEVGDFVNLLFEKYEGTQQSLIQDVTNALDVKPSYLKQLAWVSASIPPANRKPQLSYSHHRAVAALPPARQQEVLEAAYVDRLSKVETERLARGLPAGGEATAAAASSKVAPGATLEEAALEALARAASILEDAWRLVDTLGFRLTVDVGQGISKEIQQVQGTLLLLTARVDEEVGAYV